MNSHLNSFMRKGKSKDVTERDYFVINWKEWLEQNRGINGTKEAWCLKLLIACTAPPPFSPNPSFPEGRRGKREPQKIRKLNSHLNFQTWENDSGMTLNFFSKGERSEADHHSFFSFGKEDWSGMGKPATLRASGLNLHATLPHSPLISLEGEARLFKFIHTRMEGPEQNGKYHFPEEKELRHPGSLPSLGKGGLGWNRVIYWR